MLKGHVFKEQIFGNQIFALFINTFLNGQNGVSNNYKNGMQVTYSGSTLTIQSGAVCIQGRFLEEDTSTDISAGTDSSYCKLVIEIDLDKQNTESQLSQASYKIVKSSSGYPNLTQNDIVKNNAGIYQYELARFRTSSSGITNFQDMRTFLDFASIYNEIRAKYNAVLNELQQELENVEDGSAYLLKTGGKVTGKIIVQNGVYDEDGIQYLDGQRLKVLAGTITATKSDNPGTALKQTDVTLNYPGGMNFNNTAVISLTQSKNTNSRIYNFGASETSTSAGYVLGSLPARLTLNQTNMVLSLLNIGSNDVTVNYRLILLDTTQRATSV